MLTVLLVVQIIIAVAMVTVILLQRSSSDGLGGLGGGGNSIMSGRAQANLLTKTTSILAAAFMVNSLAMATITARTSGIADQVIEKLENTETTTQDTDAPVDSSVPIAE